MKKLFIVSGIIFLAACGNRQDEPNEKEKDEPVILVPENSDYYTVTYPDSSVTHFDKAIRAFKENDKTKTVKEIKEGIKIVEKEKANAITDSTRSKLVRAEKSLTVIADNISDNKRVDAEDLQEQLSKVELLLAHHYLELADRDVADKTYVALSYIAPYLEMGFNHTHNRELKKNVALIKETNDLLKKAKNNPAAHQKELKQYVAKIKKIMALLGLGAM